MSNKLPVVAAFEAKYLKEQPNVFEIGDTVNVHVRIIEGGKERIQVFTGIVIGMSGTGLASTFKVRRVSYNEGMERVFLLHSPTVSRVEVVRKGKVRRAKLNFLRGLSGKKARVKQRLD